MQNSVTPMKFFMKLKSNPFDRNIIHLAEIKA